jgi:hypothetical protein
MDYIPYFHNGQYILLLIPVCMWARRAPKIFRWGGGADPAAIYNLCFTLKIMLEKSCCKYNITLFANVFICIQI